MDKKITYRDKFTSANTIYADINAADKLLMIDTLAKAYYELIERTNYDDVALQVFHKRDKTFRKHIAADKHTHNSLGSFLAGILKQHYGNPNKDISTKMLEGVSLASQVLNALGVNCPHYVFVKETSKRIENTPFEKLFK